MIMNLKELLEKIQVYFRKIKVRKAVIKRYSDDLELEYLMEEWITKRINDGQIERRKELSDKQARIEELKKFIKYFK